MGCAVGLLLVALLPALSPAAAATDGDSVNVGGVEFARTYALPDGVLDLVGAGVLRWKVLFRAYASAFYLPPGMAPQRWQDDVAKCLTIHYFWDISRDEFGPAGRKVLARMYPAEQLAAVAAQLEAIDAAYVDVQEGDRYALVYSPGQGTVLFHNGQALVTLPGAEFARLYFSVWLGSDPVDGGLRDELLGVR